MKELLRELSPRDKFGATIWNGLIRFVRSLRLIQGPGIKLTRTPNGTIVSVKQMKAAKASSPADNSCYAIDTLEIEKDEDDEESATISVSFKNCYFRVGGKCYLGASSIEDVEAPAIVALKINLTGTAPETEIESYEDFQELTDDQHDGEYYIIPLYEFDASGLKCDFRNAPMCDAGEFAEPTEEEEGNNAE